MSIARWIGPLALVAGTACSTKPGTTTTATTTAAPCTVTDSVSGTTVPCFGATSDSVSGSTARSAMRASVVVSESGRTLPLSALTAACRDVATGAAVGCSLAISLQPATTTTTTRQSAESVSGTTGRDSAK